MAKFKAPKRDEKLSSAIANQMLTLATSGFGLVAALAWNEFIKEAVNTLVNPHLPEGSTAVSLLLYAVIVTCLAVVVTLQLAKVQSLLKKDKKAL